MVQHRWRSGNNRPDPRQLVHDHRGGSGAKRRAGPTISTEWAINGFADRHPHQPDAEPCGTAGVPERPGPKPDRAAATDDDHPAGDHPAGDVQASDLHPDLYAHPDVYAALSGADPRVQPGGTDDELVRPGHSGAHIVGALKGAAGRIV